MICKVFLFSCVLVGILADTGGPAHQAMVADLLPENKRSEGFAVLRVTANLAVTLGPIIGGLLAGIDYLHLFIIDAIMSTITAVIVFIKLPETMPERTAAICPGDQPGEDHHWLLRRDQRPTVHGVHAGIHH